MTKIQSRDAAVSPVIGVMLMLVVTIIIAAVVSSFAGSLAGGTDKAPQMAISGKLVNGTSLTLTHKGGDPIVWENTEIRTFLPSGTYKDMTWVVNLTTVSTAGTYNPTNCPIYGPDCNAWGMDEWAPSLTNGESATIDWDVLFYTGYEPRKTDPVDIQFFDKTSGKMVLSTRVING